MLEAHFSAGGNGPIANQDVETNRRLGSQEPGSQCPEPGFTRKQGRGPEHQDSKEGKHWFGFCVGPSGKLQVNKNFQKLRLRGGVGSVQSEGSGGQKTPGSSWGAHPSLPGGPALTTGLRPMARSGFQQQHPGKGLQHTTLLLYPRPREGETDRQQDRKSVV